MCQNYSGPTTGLRFAVKILKQYSENLFLIADKSGLCEMSLEDTKPLHCLLLLKASTRVVRIHTLIRVGPEDELIL